MNIWNAKVGDIISPAVGALFTIKSDDLIGFKGGKDGGKQFGLGVMGLYTRDKIELLEIGVDKCIALMVEGSTVGMVFRIPVKTLNAWWEEDDRKAKEADKKEKDKLYDDFLKNERDKQNKADQEKWC